MLLEGSFRMNSLAIRVGLVCWVSTFAVATPSVRAQEPRVQFDLPAVAVASYQAPVSTTPDPATDYSHAIPSGWSTVNFELRLSCINTSSSNQPMQQCTVRVKPRDPSLQVVDYSPRTEVMSDLTTAIQVKRSDEKTQSMGLSLDGSYGHLAHGNIGSDQGNKKTESVQFDRAAPVQAVIASGTIDRGRGVYFKLRWTDTQVLEGERRFRLTMSVPPSWRGELVDVSIVGESEHRGFGSWESQLKTVASADFIVATYIQGDTEAATLAYKLADTEYRLKHSAQQLSRRSPTTFPEMIRHVAMKIDVDSAPVDTSWLNRLLFAQADPHTDRAIRGLPADLRVVALDYVDLRQSFQALPSTATGGNRLAERTP